MEQLTQCEQCEEEKYCMSDGYEMLCDECLMIKCETED